MQPNVLLYAGNEPHMPEEPNWTNLGVALDDHNWSVEQTGQVQDSVILRIVECVPEWERQEGKPSPVGFSIWFFEILCLKSQDYRPTELSGEESSHEAMKIARQFLDARQIKVVTWQDQVDSVGLQYLEANGL